MTDTPGEEPDTGSASSGALPEAVRPSIAERQAVAAQLLAAVNEGRIEMAEYEQRLQASETVTSVAELQRLTADLPAPPSTNTPAQPEQILLQIADLSVSERFAYTPVGPIPVRGSQWFVQDQWLEHRKIPTWAILLTVFGFFCLTVLSLLFLLIKESHYEGTVDVTVANGDLRYTTRIPVRSQAQVQHIYQQVNYVRMLATR